MPADVGGEDMEAIFEAPRERVEWVVSVKEV